MSRLPYEARARALASGSSEWAPPPAEPAATVALLRDGRSGIETFLMRRARTMPFAPGMYVFPGGRVDPKDLQHDAVVSEKLAARMAAEPSLAAALLQCAVRELHEETGVVVRADEIPVIDHWITPEVEDRRYDVRFFAAALPTDQDASMRGTEADEVTWLRPSHAIDEFRAGAMAMLPPTIAVLALLADCSDTAMALQVLGERDVVPLLPRATIDPDGKLQWSLVHDRTGAVIRGAHEMPHAWESRGVES